MDSIDTLKPYDKIVAVREIKFLSSTQKFILMTMATHLGSNIECWLSLTTIKEECCLADSHTVINSIRGMIRIGILHKREANHQYKCNQYAIDFDQISYYNKLIKYKPSVVDNLHWLVGLPHKCSVATTLASVYTTPDWWGYHTRVVGLPHTKVNINKNENKEKGEKSIFEQDKKSKAAARSSPILYKSKSVELHNTTYAHLPDWTEIRLAKEAAEAKGEKIYDKGLHQTGNGTRSNGVQPIKEFIVSSTPVGGSA